MAMTNNAHFSFRLSENLKKESFNIIEKYGFTPSQVFNLILTEIANTKTIPVNLSYLEPNEVTLRSMAEIENGESEIIPISKDMDTLRILSELNSKDNV